MTTDTLGWLQTSEARAVAASALARSRLPASLVDDVLQEARLSVWRTLDESALVPENPTAYAHRAVTNAVYDLHRRRARRVEETSLDDDGQVAPTSVSDVVLRAELEDDCRRVAAESVARRPWAAAAVLNHLTFTLHPDVPIPDGAPSPEIGVDDQRAAWAALWLAGKTECFPSEEGIDDATTRQRRARAIAVVTDHLRRVYETATSAKASP